MDQLLKVKYKFINNFVCFKNIKKILNLSYKTIFIFWRIINFYFYKVYLKLIKFNHINIFLI